MNGLTHTYNLTIDGLAVTAVLTFNGAHGILLCSYDDRSISVRLGSQVEYMREDACRALKSRRVMADMVGEAQYSRKATCRSIANRLDLLVQQGDIEGDAAQEVINEVRGKWRGLQTSHDFDRFVSTNLTAKQHLALCKRTDDDFETLIAPALAKAIKEDIETDLEIGAPVMGTANDANIATIAVEKVRSVLAFHDLGECLTFVDGIDVLDETVADLRECLAESDDLASDRWAALLSTNNIVCAALNDRGVPATGLFAANVRALVEYLSAVEAAAAKWQAAGLAWQKQAQDDADMLMHEAMLRMYPRSTHLTSHRPKGLLEVAGNVTAGLEPVYSETYERRVNWASRMEAAGYDTEVPMTAEQRYAHTVEGIADRFRFTAEMGEALLVQQVKDDPYLGRPHCPPLSAEMQEALAASSTFGYAPTSRKGKETA